MPKTGGLSFSNVPRPPVPLRRFRHPLQPFFLTTSGCPLWPATPYGSSHSTLSDNVTAGFFYGAFTQGSRHLVDIAAIHIQLVGNKVDDVPQKWCLLNHQSVYHSLDMHNVDV